jgi:hypothetical protein
MSLQPPETVGKLQATLHTKAKESPTYRFYALYDKVYRADVLTHAYERCRANGGAAGVDGQTFTDIQEYGAERWLEELAQTLKANHLSGFHVWSANILANGSSVCNSKPCREESAGDV